MKTYELNTLSKSERLELLKRPKMDFSAIFDIVSPIVEDVQENGDKAVKKYTSKFDGVQLDEITLDPTSLTISLPDEVRLAIDTAFENISKFHEAQHQPELFVETMPGVICRKVMKPIERVGLYVPGGTAILPSTAMMLAIPAMIAECKTIILATPPNDEGNVPEEVAYIAQKAGVSKILLAGGAQAVAAMALGTESVPKVDKIFGPGNQFVTAAKMILQNSEAQISIDMPAGPSEVLVIADKTARPSYVAADLLSQAEHGADSQVVLVAIDGFDLLELSLEISSQLQQLPRREMASKALNNSFIVKVGSIDDALSFSNEYAPEHLIINVEEEDSTVDHISNAGSVFLGQFTPESVGDYASGTNHTLPTYGYARMYSGVNLASFQKSITLQKLTSDGLAKLGPTVEILASTEGLDAHKNAVTIRLRDLSDD